MTPVVQIKLLFPPIGALMAFVLTWNIERNTSATGKVSSARLKAYAVVCVGLMFFCYGIIWQDEIRAAFEANLLWMSLSTAGVVATIIYLFAIRDRPEPIDLESEMTASTSKQKPSTFRRVLSWVIIVWGTLGLLGGIVTTIRHALLQ